MMGSAVVRRIFACWLGFWFTLVSVDPVSLHSCPMHDPAPIAKHTTDAVAMHHEHGHDHAAPSEAPSVPKGGHACLCLGDCHSGTAAVLPHVPLVVPATQVVVVGVSRQPRPRDPVEVQPSCVLPFATAPPVSMT